MDDASAEEVVRYLNRHLHLATIERSHTLTASEHWFRLRGEVNGELFVLESCFEDWPAERVFQRLQALQVAEALRAAAGKRRVVVTPTKVRYEDYSVRPKRRRKME